MQQRQRRRVQVFARPAEDRAIEGAQSALLWRLDGLGAELIGSGNAEHVHVAPADAFVPGGRPSAGADDQTRGIDAVLGDRPSKEGNPVRQLVADLAVRGRPGSAACPRASFSSRTNTFSCRHDCVASVARLSTRSLNPSCRRTRLYKACTMFRSAAEIRA